MLEDVGRQLAIGVQHDGEHPAQSLFDDWVGVVSVRSRERKLDRIEACHAFSEALILMNRPCGLPRACTSHPSATKDMKIGERRAEKLSQDFPQRASLVVIAKATVLNIWHDRVSYRMRVDLRASLVCSRAIVPGRLLLRANRKDRRRHPVPRRI